MAEEETQQKAVSVKLDQDLYERLRDVAKENDRTITGELRRAIRVYLTTNGPRSSHGPSGPASPSSR